MNSFCSNCGSPLGSGDAFCVKCGARAQQTASPAPAASAPPAPSAEPAASGSKWLWIAGGVFAVVVVLGATGAYLAYRKAKQVVTEVAERTGISLPESGGSSASARAIDPCRLLSREEAEQITQVKYEKAESTGAAASARCVYTPVPLNPEQQQEQFNKALEELKQKTSDPNSAANKAAESGDAGALMRDSGLGELTRTLAAGLGGGGGKLSVAWHGGDGATQIHAVRIALRATAGNLNVSEELKGIGDEALLGPMDSMIVVRKGADGVVIEYGGPGGKQVLVELARRVASRM